MSCTRLSRAREDAIPYEIYFLENQEPEHLAEVLQKILQEKVQDKDAKVEKTIRKTEEEIVIVPDKNTFSIIVYASMKNQEWINKLIKALDKRRPQVLIDATLVEITKADAFTYDLNLLGSLPNIASTAAITGADPNLIVGRAFLSDKGFFTGFYGDEHIRALLQAMQSKNYGRVLAKPKILVNDNEQGMIKTTDVTYVETSSSIPVTSGTAGPQTNFVQTAVRFEPYEAGITLDITPHISEGDLLRLEVALTRSDFLETEDPKKPPNTRSNEVTTKVTVPDGSTIILGGLLKLNQNKGGGKVPILGDIPLIGGLFRSINNKDTQNKLYVFVKAEIIRPAEQAGKGMDQLTAISERDRAAFERSEQQFQAYEDWPGIKPKPVEPAKVLDAR
jgi:general secretion pathway protein D